MISKILSFNQFIKESVSQDDNILSETKGSKIIDKSGKLLVVYKAAKDQTILDTEITTEHTTFTTSKKEALGYGKDICKYVIYLNNPLYITSYGLDVNSPADYIDWYEAKTLYFDNQEDPIKLITELGFDGIVELNDKNIYHEKYMDQLLTPNKITIFDPANAVLLGNIRWYEVYNHTIEN